MHILSIQFAEQSRYYLHMDQSTYGEGSILSTK
jgi:hypothetical protein